MMRNLFLPLLLVAASAPAAAMPVGETHRIADVPQAAVRDSNHRPQLRVTIWYPAAKGSREQPIVIGPQEHPVFTIGSAAMDAPPAPASDQAQGRWPVILISHGYGGTARMMGWFGIAMARRGYIVVAVDHPGNNGMDPMTVPGALLFWQRADDLRAALNLAQADPLIGAHIDRARVAVAGFSAGGFTALVAGGARSDLPRFQTFCAANPDDGVCRPQPEFPIDAEQRKAALADPSYAEAIRHAVDDRTIPGVRAVFAMAPALVQALDPASLRRMKVPTVVLLGAADDVAPPATNGRIAAGLIPHARLVALPAVTHYDFLAECAAPEEVKLCDLAKHQPAAHAAAIEAADGLFRSAFRR